MRRALALALVLLPALAVACTADADTETPTPEPTAPSLDPFGVPPATLHTAAGEIPGEPGTHCWANACIDLIGPLTPAVTSRVAPGETLALDFAHGTPSEVTYAWIPAASPAPTPAANHVIAWSGLFPPIAEPIATGLDAPSEPGPYVLIATAFWDGDGDVSYGFYLEVE